jgi:hypothetical protein
MAGVLLIWPLAVIGATILFIGQMIWIHLFVGLLLIGPALLKMASTGYRFLRYYTLDPAYREKGSPPLALRAIAPGVVLTTVAVFVSGLVLLFDGPSGRNQWLSIHKISFIAWLIFAGLHVLGHLAGLGPALRATDAGTSIGGGQLGRAGRWISIGGAIVGGLILALVLIPDFAPWTGHGVFAHHHHG